jgi:DNA-directed RNA polymerase specialized sigma24 family protein
VSALVDHPAGPDGGDVAEPEPGSPTSAGGAADVEQDPPGPSPLQLRVDFGAHLEANYQRLVAQLYAITLDPDEAHGAVQDAYSRAWRSWAVIGSSPDPAAWIRRVAVRSTMRSWRRALAACGLGRSARPALDSLDARTATLLTALRWLTPAERRGVVLFHTVGMPLDEIAELERVSVEAVQARLARAYDVIMEELAGALPVFLAHPGPAPHERASR